MIDTFSKKCTRKGDMIQYIEGGSKYFKKCYEARRVVMLGFSVIHPKEHISAMKLLAWNHGRISQVIKNYILFVS